MKKYSVSLFFHTSITIDVEAEDEHEAIGKARAETSNESHQKSLIYGMQEDSNPDVSEIEIERVQRTLRLHNMPSYEINQPEDGRIEINIWRGDWKHDHLLCDRILEELGYRKDEEIMLEKGNSDSYSSTHVYIRNK